MISTTQQCDLKASVISIGDKSQDHEYGVWLLSTFVTQGNASADAVRTFLIFSMQGKKELAEKYLDLFALKSGIAKNHIQLCIPVVAAVELTRGKEEEKEFLKQWIDIKNYE